MQHILCDIVILTCYNKERMLSRNSGGFLMTVDGAAADDAMHFLAEYELECVSPIPRRVQTETLTLASAAGSRGFK